MNERAQEEREQKSDFALFFALEKDEREKKSFIFMSHFDNRFGVVGACECYSRI
jgi:hypothetical protein